MNQSFYTGAVGAQQQLLRLNIHGDNIANVNTVGFKADRARFLPLMYQNYLGIDNEQLPIGVGTKVLMTSTDFSQGGVIDNGNTLDYSIEGDGFFALANLETGEISFTRNGAFMMAEYERASDVPGPDGRYVEKIFCLSDGEGRFVLSENGGLIEVTDPTEKLPIGIFDYSNYDGMLQITDTRFMPVDKNGSLWYGTGKLHQGVLEMSNTDLAEELSKVIEAQRAYGLALKMVQTSDEIEVTINGLRN